jgi:muramoyltetrapeptide carboxypeptidase LdcA involved in peptidoglycan recycling
VRSLGERGLLAQVAGVVLARPPTMNFEVAPSPAERRARRDAQRDTAIDMVQRYDPEAVVVVGPPFGHTRPQWILPYGGEVVLDATSRHDLRGLRLISGRCRAVAGPSRSRLNLSGPPAAAGGRRTRRRPA